MTDIIVPEENEGSSREELICPHCFSYLERHPVYVEQYSGRTALKKATRCKDQRGENCPYSERVPPDVMEEILRDQYVSPTLVSRIREKMTLKKLGVMVGGLLFIVFFIGVNPFAPDPTTVQGEIITGQVGQEFDEVNIYDYNTGELLSSGKQFTYQTTQETNTLSIVPEGGNMAATYVRISPGGEVLESSTNAQFINGSLQITLPEKRNIDRLGTISDGNIAMNISNPANINDNITVTFSPPEGDTLDSSNFIRSGIEKEINIIGSVTSQEARITGLANTETIVNNKQWRQSPQEITFEGNQNPEEVSVSLTPESDSITETKRKLIQRNGNVDISVGSNQSEAEIDLFGDISGNSQTESGTWNNNSSLSITVPNGPATLKASLTGKAQTNRVQQNGQVQSGTLPLEVQGQSRVNDLKINFTGGNTITNTAQTERTYTFNGENTERQVFTPNESGTYQISTEIDQQSEPFNGGFYINNERRTGSTTEEVNLSENDRIGIWVESRETTGTNTQKTWSPPGYYPIEVTNTEVSKQQVSTGETFTVTGTMTNNGNSNYRTGILLFKDGRRTREKTQQIAPGQSYNFEFTGVSFQTEGTHTISINEGEQIQVLVGEERNTGSGEISININKVNENTTQDASIRVDTNRDGEVDCQTNPFNGTCTIESITPGEYSLKTEQENIQNTQYTATYTSTTGQQNPSLTIGNNIIINRNGYIEQGETITETTQIEEGTHQVDISTENGDNINYNLEWGQSSRIIQPQINVNGNTEISSSNSTRELTTYPLGNLTQGNNTISISTSSSEPYYARIKWQETGNAIYPRINFNGRTVCQKNEVANNNCIFNPNEKTGEISLTTNRNTDYTIRYNSITIPQTINTIINGNTVEINKPPNTNGEWTRIAQINGLSQGTNNIRLETNPEETEATAQINYTQLAERPVEPSISLETSTGNTYQKEIPPDKISLQTNELTEPITFNISQDQITRGTNYIYFRNQNSQGMIRIRVQGTFSEVDTIEFND
jgi:hypothetical protein